MNVTLTIEVTQEDIDKGGTSAHDCPHQCAIQRSLAAAGYPNFSVCVSPSSVRVYTANGACAGSPTAEMPTVAHNWIIDYDQRQRLGYSATTVPITYELTVMLPD